MINVDSFQQPQAEPEPRDIDALAWCACIAAVLLLVAFLAGVQVGSADARVQLTTYPGTDETPYQTHGRELVPQVRP